MARLTRKNIKVFAENATNNGVFGSLQANNPTTTSDIEQIQSLSAWGEGWNAATQTAEKLPPLEEMQGIQYVLSYQQAYIMQEGVPEWSAEVTYYKGGMIKEITSDGFILYVSKADNNKGFLPNNTSYWSVVFNSADPYAFDSDVVHITGDETVGGLKTFSRAPIVEPATALTVPVFSATKQLASSNITNTELGYLDGVTSSIQTQLNAKAPLASPTFTGTPKAPTPTSTSNDTTVATTAFVASRIMSVMDSLLSDIYPIGSTYISTTNSCPLSTLISGSTWTQIASNVVVSVNTNVPVKGTGKTLGLTNGTTNGGIVSRDSTNLRRLMSPSAYNVDVSSSVPSETLYTGMWGVTTDSSKSGIVGTVTRTNLTLYIFKRTA